MIVIDPFLDKLYDEIGKIETSIEEVEIRLYNTKQEKGFISRENSKRNGTWKALIEI